AKGLTLTANISADMPATLFGDPVYVQQILVNLVSNALKFTHQGTIHVEFYRPNDAHWILQVSDTGPGIPIEAQAYIFEPFRQVDGSMTREQGGAGLGLSIVKQLTELMGGQVTLVSEVGRGTTFIVQLPVTLVQEEINQSIIS
ncbi:MAG TPA: ATP-binding protein, partial [Anaerolineae bacterium]|nr:ATP-binding protein [Anaerolineae bacterium]